mmetsp:Transcript_27517/g.62431  ORF Transcript_27517/g.62431 Transcript_27517/m.62431 type:complete len:219 (-) Transcript_27517:319-975(-)
MSMSFRSPGSDGREREVGLADRGRPLDRLRYVQGAGEERGDVHVLATLLQNPPQPLEGQVPQENLARVQRRSPPVRLPLQHLRKQLLNLFEGLLCQPLRAMEPCILRRVSEDLEEEGEVSGADEEVGVALDRLLLRLSKQLVQERLLNHPLCSCAVEQCAPALVLFALLQDLSDVFGCLPLLEEQALVSLYACGIRRPPQPSHVRVIDYPAAGNDQDV